jgi:SAM-dependent methyltransferase
MPKPKPQLVPRSPRPRDLLKLTRFPIHPFDQTYGVDTSGLVPAAHLRTGHPSDEHVTAYYAVAPSILRQLIALWRETIPPYPISRYTFLDIGAGKGRGLLVASQLHFKRVIGVELNPALAAIARANVAQWTAAHAADSTAPLLCPIEVFEQDALDLVLPRTPTLIFLFHPFEAPVLKQLLDTIHTQLSARASTGKKSSAAPSIAASSRWVEDKLPALDMLYVNAECAGVFDAHPAFTQIFLDKIPMTPEDHAADREAIAAQKEYGSTGDEECAIYRYTPPRP